MSDPGAQQQLIDAIVATGRPVSVVLFNGGIVAIDKLKGADLAIIEAWYVYICLTSLDELVLGNNGNFVRKQRGQGNKGCARAHSDHQHMHCVLPHL